MKFGKKDIGVFIEGATIRNSEEQSIEILKFAKSQGFDCDIPSLDEMFDWSYDDYEELGWAVEDAMSFLNTVCTDEEVCFTFRDTDFVLIGVDDLD